MRSPVFLVLLLAALGCGTFSCSGNGDSAEAKPGDIAAFAKDNPDLFDAKIAGDLKAVRIYRSGLEGALAFVRSRTDLFPEKKPDKPRLLSRQQREAVWNTWQSLLDYYLALDSLGKYHSAFHKLGTRDQRERSFLVTYSAFLTQYRIALDFIDRIEKNPDLDTLLNEPVTELGLPKRTYARFKLRFLNPVRATEFVALGAVNQLYGGDSYPEVRKAADADRAGIWKMGRGRGHVLTIQNALKIIETAGVTAWFPVQAGVSEWMGDTKVWRWKKSLVSPEQIAAMLPRLRPGDILLQRREWYVSNVGLPGYWPHAALYIGTPDERRRFFDDPGVKAWIKQQDASAVDFEKLLAAKYPDAYKAGVAPQEEGHVPRILEAMSEGVSFTTLEHSAAADAVVVLRPKLSKKEKASAILRAFHYSGRPYDFNFDFLTDSALVCTELVYKAYEPGGGVKGLRLPLSEMLGRKLLPANDIAVLFDREFGKGEEQFDFVLFLDGHERSGGAVESTPDAFRKSHTRAKWHIITQGKPEESGPGG
jgi:hypothetical protein